MIYGIAVYRQDLGGLIFYSSLILQYRYYMADIIIIKLMSSEPTVSGTSNL